MPIEIRMPKLGESVVEGTIGKWLKVVGDRIAVDEALVEVDTDKVSAEIPSPVAGTVTALLAPEGTTVGVDQPIAVVAVEGDEPATPVAEPATAVSTPQAATTMPAVTTPAAAKGAERPPHNNTPAVRHLAAESGIDPSDVQGTGNNGRVTRKDMEAAIAASKSALAESEYVQPVTIVEETPLPSPHEGDSVLPLTRMRKSIAEHMTASKRIVPHAWTMVEVDVTSLVRFRESIKEDFRQREGFSLTYMPFVIKAAVEGLREYPILNSQWVDDHIVIKKHINISVAVDLEDGIIVPVIKDADQKSIVGLARSVHELATRARAGTLKPDDVQGGTFTVNNTGAFGSVMSAPIINYPQAAILSMETITRRPVVVGDGIAIRSMVNLCVSLDHRILDGAVIARFLKSVRRRLESYDDTTPIY